MVRRRAAKSLPAPARTPPSYTFRIYTALAAVVTGPRIRNSIPLGANAQERRYYNYMLRRYICIR